MENGMTQNRISQEQSGQIGGMEEFSVEETKLFVGT
jgi:hypothetical protein